MNPKRTQLLRFITAGSVDNGKSTLIGRLLYDSKALFRDQIESIGNAEAGAPDLASITDGLREERELKITIDVAYRYFATPARKFILADCPGHAEFTRNMFTGASTANLALLLVDAQEGLTEQSYRHSAIAGLLQIPHLVVCINKMDSVGWSEEKFNEIRFRYEEFSAKLGIRDISYIPISALLGDNVVRRSEHMPWYQGSTLLSYLENLHINSDRNLVDLRFSVQYAVRHDGKCFVFGRLNSGSIRTPEQLVSLPGKNLFRVERVFLGEKNFGEAQANASISLVLSGEGMPGEGDILCRESNRPEYRSEADAMLCWMSERAAENKNYLMRHLQRETTARMEEITYFLDIQTLHRTTKPGLPVMNDICRVKLRLEEPLPLESYARNKSGGSFILIDTDTGDSVAGGVIR